MKVSDLKISETINLKSTAPDISKYIKNIQINGIDLLYTRTENGDVEINNINIENLDEEKYKMELIYEE